MASSDKSKRLIVEGEQDKRVIPYLMEANGIPWKKGNEPVDIKPYGGDGFIDPYRISARLKETGLTHLGLMLDADDDASDRWQSIRNACLQSIPNIPEQIPETGLIINIKDEKKFGVWIMPDNQMKGMLETFLAYMIPGENEPLWQYTHEVVVEAKVRGAKFINSHIDKAYIYSWLAWQNPPGRQLHNAIEEKILDPQHPKAQVFINWFKTLYDL
ncbi:MAG: hypothetical protein EAZ77_08800 [Nostocales cyanobacterium]|nr:MAG: hypothetical protein EAZ77_08800 [Nostocales cyanobacterium]